MSERIRVLIADDEPLIRRGLRSYLEDASDIEVVGEASSGPAAVRLAHQLQADVVLADLRMPGGSGIDAIHKLTRPGRLRRTAVVAITSSDTIDNVFGAIEHGANGVLLKTSQPHELADAIRAAAHGEGYLAPALVPRVFSEFRRRRVPELSGPTLAETHLNKREIQLLYALTHGLSNEELAAHLEVSIGTVKGVFSSIKRKLNLDERRHLVVWAFNNGLNHQAPADDWPHTNVAANDAEDADTGSNVGEAVSDSPAGNG